MQWLSLAVIVIVAVGLPLTLMYYLIQKTKTYDRDFRAKNAETAKRMSIELGVTVEAAGFVIRDVTIGRDLSFVIVRCLSSTHTVCRVACCRLSSLRAGRIRTRIPVLGGR